MPRNPKQTTDQSKSETSTESLVNLIHSLPPEAFREFDPDCPAVFLERLFQFHASKSGEPAATGGAGAPTKIETTTSEPDETPEQRTARIEAGSRTLRMEKLKESRSRTIGM